MSNVKTVGLFVEDVVLLYISEELVITENVIVFKSGDPTNGALDKAQKPLKSVGRTILGKPYKRQDGLWEARVQEAL